MNPLLLQINLSGTPWNDSIYYLSNESYEGVNFYFPFLSDVPVLEIGGTASGFLRVSLGSLKILNLPRDINHPFHGTNYSRLINQAIAIPFSIFMSEKATALFTGNLALVGLTQNELNFQIFEETSSINDILFLKKGLDSTGTVVSKINKNVDNEVEIEFSSDHTFFPGQKVLFSGMTLVGTELGYVVTTDNFYTVNRVTDLTMTIKDRDGVAVPETFLAIMDNEINDGVITASGSLSPGFSVPSGSTITLNSGVTVTVLTTNTAVCGESTGRPLAFGKVSHVTPITTRSKTLGLLLNPEFEFLSSSPSVIDTYLTAYEDGVQIGTAQAAQSTTFATTPTTDLITLNAGFKGEVSLNGVGIHGTTIKDFFDLVVATLSLESTITLDVTKAPQAASYTPGFQQYADGIISSMVSETDFTTTDDIYISRDTSISDVTISSGDTLKINSGFILTVGTYLVPSIFPTFVDALAFYETKQTSFLSFVSDLAHSINYQFYIKGTVFYLIDRGYNPATINTFYDYEIEEANYEIIPPIRSIISNWEIKQATGEAVTGGAPEQGYPKLVTIPQNAIASFMASGQDINVKSYHQNPQAVTAYLENILAVAKKPVVSITVNDINESLTFGDRIQYSRAVDYITADFLVRKIVYNFRDRKTTFAGDAVLTQLEAA